MKKNILSLLLIVVIIGTGSGFAQGEIDNKAISAAVLADYETGDIMYSHNLDKRIEIASITKIMTYLVTMDEVSKGNSSLEDMVIISEKSARRGGSSFILKAGESHKLGKLIESTMIASANDACIAIAEHVSGDEKTFIELMNAKAKELKLEKSHFVSVNGFPEEGEHNTMSSRDILTLTRYTINKYPQILDITSKQILLDEDRGIQFTNTNPLLGTIDGIMGLKTGYADEAGYCLVSIKKSQDSNMIAIVMGAGNKSIRKEESLKLLQGNISTKYKKEKILDSNIAIDSIVIPGSANGKIKIFAEDDIYGMIDSIENISKTTNIYDYLEFPIKPGQPVGEIVLKYDDNIKRINLVAKEEILKEGFINTSIFVMRSFLAHVF